MGQDIIPLLRTFLPLLSAGGCNPEGCEGVVQIFRNEAGGPSGRGPGKWVVRNTKFDRGLRVQMNVPRLLQQRYNQGVLAFGSFKRVGLLFVSYGRPILLQLARYTTLLQFICLPMICY